MHAVWVEIPVKDINRALTFYQAVFECQPTDIVDDGIRRTSILVNTSEGRAGISLNQTANFEPSDRGSLIYIDTGEDLTPHLERVSAAGGQVIETKTSMGEFGNYAIFRDTEGNQLALYSYK